MEGKQAEIHIWHAIHLMRELTAKGEMFSFSFATYNRQTRSCSGMRAVQRAYLRPAAKTDDIAHADQKLFFFDDVEQKPRVCWQPLIMFFNGFKVIL